MEFRLWDYKKDKCRLESFLSSAAIAHGYDKENESWFNWKYRGCPDGECLLVCAIDGDIVAGCVAMRIGRIAINGQEKIYGASYENFVNPKYQRRGIFVKLIKIAETICYNRGMEFLICFPNSNSLPGYKKAGWISQRVMKCRIKITSTLRVISNLSSLRKPFILRNIKNNVIELSDKEFDWTDKHRNMPIWDKEYLMWRFGDMYRCANCCIDSENFFAIARVGNRGKLKECQIITVMPYGIYSKQKAFSEFIEYVQCREKPDIITCCDIMSNESYMLYTGFFVVPTKVNFVYKILQEGSINPSNIEMDAMFFHTY